MEKLIEAAAVYPREWQEVAERRTAWTAKAGDVQNWFSTAVSAVQQAVPFFQDKLVVRTNLGELEQEGKRYCNPDLLTVFVAMAPMSTAEFRCDADTQPIHVLESGFVLALTPALNGEIVASLQTHAIAGNQPETVQLRIFHNPGKITEFDAQQLLEQAFTHAAPTSVLFSRDPEPAPGTRTTVGFRRNGESAEEAQAWQGSIQQA